MVKGGGYEACGPGQPYTNCSLYFGDIENIHDVRKAQEKMFALGLKSVVKTNEGRSMAKEWIMGVE
jgi:hypothetical protein